MSKRKVDLYDQSSEQRSWAKEMKIRFSIECRTFFILNSEFCDKKIWIFHQGYHLDSQ